MAITKQQQTNMDAKVNVRNFPSLTQQQQANEEAEQHRKNRRRWWLSLTHALGITMQNANKPSGWSLNPATVTLAILVAGLLTGGGYYVGEKNAEYRNLMERIQDAERKAAAADTKATYAVRETDNDTGHTKPNANANTTTRGR